MKKRMSMRIVLAVCLTVVIIGCTVVALAEETTVPTTTVPQTTTKAKTPKVAKKFMKQTPKFTSIALVNKKKIELTINQVKNAQGYKIYRKTNKGKAKNIITAKPGKTKFYDKNARYGNNYIYSVKAYMKYKGKTYYTNNRNVYVKKFQVKKKKKGKYYFICDMNNHKVKNPLAFLRKPKFMLKVNVVASTMTVFAKNGSKGYNIPVHVYLIAGNTYDTAGHYKLGPKYRFRGLYYNSHSQWSARIYEDILFHTTLYKRSQDPNSLDTKTYNKLGTPSSHGCIRLQCVAAKFIYDKCPVGTPVILCKSKNPGPLGKPKLEKIKKWHTWDPTDPTMKWKCKKHHCKHKQY